MARTLTDLDRIDVRKPCSVAWDSMSGDDRTRFCRECNKQVYDFSRMTRGEIENLIARESGQFCARFSRRTDGTIETADSLTGSVASRRRVPLRVSTALSAVLSLCASAFAQSPTNPAEPQKQRPPYVLRRDHERKEQPHVTTTELHGTIFDPTNAVIAQALVKLINQTSKKEYTATTNDDGTYHIANVASGTYAFQAQSTGFRTFTKSRLDLKAGEEVRLDATLQASIMGEVIIVKDDNPASGVSKVLLFPYRALRKIAGTSR
jgi:hypothetical protein